MKYRILVLFCTLFILALGSCSKSTVAPGNFHAFRIPEYKTRHHWGMPRKFSMYRSSTISNRYWGGKRYGAKLRRGKYRGN